MTTESVPNIRRKGTRSEIRSGSVGPLAVSLTQLNRPNIALHESFGLETQC